MKTFIITKVEKYGESTIHVFIVKNKPKAKKYLTFHIAGYGNGIFNLYKPNKNNKLNLIDTIKQG